MRWLAGNDVAVVDDGDRIAKLLRFLENRKFMRVGGSTKISVDARLVCATLRPLEHEVQAGRFRADLYYRLNVFPIVLPPLRDRPEDIPLLARHFLEQYRVKLNRSCKDIDQDSLERLVRYAWPGNVRELETVIERAMILSHEPVLRIEDKALGSQDTSLAAPPPAGLKELERQHILQTLTLANWHIEGPDGAAARLQMPPSTLRSRLKQLGIRRPPSH